MQKKWNKQKANQQNPKTQKQNKRVKKGGKKGKSKRVKNLFLHLFCFFDLFFFCFALFWQK
jgi:hypothetical protein